MGKKEKRGLSMDWEQTWESSVSHCAPMTAAWKFNRKELKLLFLLSYTDWFVSNNKKELAVLEGKKNHAAIQDSWINLTAINCFYGRMVWPWNTKPQKVGKTFLCLTRGLLFLLVVWARRLNFLVSSTFLCLIWGRFQFIRMEMMVLKKSRYCNHSRLWKGRSHGALRLRKRISKVNSLCRKGENRVKERKKRVEKDMINNSKATQRCFFLPEVEKKRGEREKMAEEVGKIQDHVMSMAGGHGH